MKSPIVTTLFLALLLSADAYSQDKSSEIDKIFNWTTPTTPGCVCAVSQNGQLVANRAYGSADMERDVPINSNTIFDLYGDRKSVV